MELTLNLPTNYVEIEQEEMMYLDGGAYCVNEGWGSWYVHFTKSDLQNIAVALKVGQGVSYVLSGILALAGAAKFAAVTAIAGTIAGVASWVFKQLAKTNGLRVYFKAYVIANWVRTY